MDGPIFDQFTRALATLRTRRGAVGLATAAVTGATVAAEAKPRTEGPCGDGSRRANVCTKNKDCCTGLCNTKAGKKNKDGKGRCRCVRKGGTCTANRNCCNSLGCNDGICGGAPAPSCTPMVCASGCAYTSIQAAIDAAAPGDTIAITDGPYTEDLTIDKNLTLLGCPTATVINAGQDARTVTITDGVTVEIRNLTIDGTGTSSTVGGGIDCHGKLTLSGTTLVTHGASEGSGGGIYVHETGSSLTMKDTAAIDTCSAVSGGGVYLSDDANLTLNDSAKIVNCTAIGGGGGGVATRVAETTIEVTGSSEISGCVASNYHGGGVHLAEATMTMSGASTVRNNTAGFDGGGIYVYFDGDTNYSSLTLTGSATITGNTANADNGGYTGGGIFSNFSDNTVIVPLNAVTGNQPDNCVGSGFTC
jgi:hypothetical protein